MCNELKNKYIFPQFLFVPVLSDVIAVSWRCQCNEVMYVDKRKGLQIIKRFDFPVTGDKLCRECLMFLLYDLPAELLRVAWQCEECGATISAWKADNYNWHLIYSMNFVFTQNLTPLHLSDSACAQITEAAIRTQESLRESVRRTAQNTTEFGPFKR